jgi:hypothetical protein
LPPSKIQKALSAKGERWKGYGMNQLKIFLKLNKYEKLKINTLQGIPQRQLPNDKSKGR